MNKCDDNYNIVLLSSIIDTLHRLGTYIFTINRNVR